MKDFLILISILLLIMAILNLLINLCSLLRFDSDFVDVIFFILLWIFCIFLNINNLCRFLGW